jgi:hypothetical protein
VSFFTSIPDLLFFDHPGDVSLSVTILVAQTSCEHLISSRKSVSASRRKGVLASGDRWAPDGPTCEGQACRHVLYSRTKYSPSYKVDIDLSFLSLLSDLSCWWSRRIP